MAPQSKEAKEGEYLGDLEGMPCYRCKLRGEGLTDINSNWRLWKADTQVYKDAANTYPSPPPSDSDCSDSEEDDSKDKEDKDKETWKTVEDEFLAKSERRRKAYIWFRVSIPLREQHLSDMGGRDKTSDDVFRRLYERVAPPGSPWMPLPKLVITEEMRKEIREIEKMRGKTWK